MNSLQTIVSQVNDIATEASSGTNSSTQLSTYATQVAALIQQAVQLGNTQDANGNYIFSGTATSTQPFVATTDSNGNITRVTYRATPTWHEVTSGQTLPSQRKFPARTAADRALKGLFSDSRSGSGFVQ